MTKLFFKNEEIKTLPDKQKLKAFISLGLPYKKYEILQTEIKRH